VPIFKKDRDGSNVYAVTFTKPFKASRNKSVKSSMVSEKSYPVGLIVEAPE
jgi:hypothetical protein